MLSRCCCCEQIVKACSETSALEAFSATVWAIVPHMNLAVDNSAEFIQVNERCHSKELCCCFASELLSWLPLLQLLGALSAFTAPSVKNVTAIIAALITPEAAESKDSDDVTIDFPTSLLRLVVEMV